MKKPQVVVDIEESGLPKDTQKHLIENWNDEMFDKLLKELPREEKKRFALNMHARRLNDKLLSKQLRLHWAWQAINVAGVVAAAVAAVYSVLQYYK